MKFMRVCEQIVPADDEAWQWYAGLEEGQEIEIQVIESRRPRTLTQNRALHKFLELLATTLNDAGLDMKKVIREDVDIPWDKSSTKEYLWRPIQKAMIGKASTAEAETPDYSEVHKVLSRHLGQKFGVEVPEWPSLR